MVWNWRMAMLATILAVNGGTIHRSPALGTEPPVASTPTVPTIAAGAVAASGGEIRTPMFQVPDGYIVELAAGPPLVKHPLMAGFDDKGRLYVAESAGLNLKRADLEKQLPNFVRRLEDTDGDGRFDSSTIFADKMTFPQGALWHNGALYVASSGNIWRLQDTNNDGVADRREMIVSQFGYTGNAADVHGCFLGPNGRIYWCEGRHGHDIVDADGNPISQGKAARIFSCRTDGSDVKIHCGGGMDNPVEIDFLPEGEMVGTVNILLQKRGDCLVHWMHGGVYPRTDQPKIVAEFRRTGDLLPPIHDYGHVAVSGMCRYRGQQLGAEFRDNMFVTEFNTHKVKRTKLVRDGASFRAEVTDFLQAASDDFHPTDVLEDADGSLLVIDTGGWFRIGCPTSQIEKPNILGAIYRIRKKEGTAIADPRGKKIEWSEPDPPTFVDLLADSRPAVREQATQRLVRMASGAGENAVLRALNNAYAKPVDYDQKLNIVWTLIRIGSDYTREPLRKALGDADAGVRQVALHGIGLLADQPALDKVIALLSDESPSVRREAATTLGLIGNSDAIGPLLTLLRSDIDRMLEHAVIYAVIEIDNPELTADGLKSESPKIRRGALIALDQMKNGNLRQEQVGPLLDTNDAALQAVALDVISRRAGWGDELIELASKLLAEASLTTEQQTLISGALVAFRTNDKVQSLVAESLQNEKLSTVSRKLLLDVIGRSDVKPSPPAWIEVLREMLAKRDDQILNSVVGAASSMGARSLDESLLKLSRDTTLPSDTRIAGLAAVAAHGLHLESFDFALLLTELSDDNPPMKRLAAARAIATATLTGDQLREITRWIAKSGPLEIGQLLAPFEKSKDPEVGKNLFQALAGAPGATAITLSQLEKLAAQFTPETSTFAAPIFEKLRAATAQQRVRLDEMEKKVAAGGASAGREVFFGRRTACFACHKIGKEGGAIGPDLSTIGQRRNHRDLLEAILFPSASLARGYESHTITTQGGKVINGLITRETNETLFIRSADQTDLQIPRNDVESMQPSPVSVMPAGMENTMSVEQLADLLAFLESLK